MAMLYIRFGCQISLGGREWAGLCACLMASFATSAFGTLIGALPGIPTGAKQGLCTALACILSLFSGLYGSFAMDLSDQIAQHAPILSTLNPAQQVTNPVLRHSVLRQFPAVPHHGGRAGCNELGLACCGDRSAEEAAL